MRIVTSGAHFALLCVLAVLLSGCTENQPAGDIEAAAVPGAPAAARGGVLRMIQEAPLSLDPADVGSVYDSLPVNQVFDGLVDLDAGLNVTPALASTWTRSRDGRVYTFSLRPGVRFHDGGGLTADDVVYTFERILAPGLERRSLVFTYLAVVAGAMDFAEGRSETLAGVTAVDPLTVRIELERPYMSFLEVLAMDGLRIVPRAVVEREGKESFSHQPVGTGPFRLAAWTDDRLRLVANADYFGGPPRLDSVELLFLGEQEDDVGFARFDRGELHVLEPGREHLESLSHDPDVKVHRYQELNLLFLGLLCGAPGLERVEVRQAISMAIDRDRLAAESPGTRRPAVGILPPGMPGFSPQRKGLPFDPEGARRKLEEAGYPGGRGLPPVRFYTTGRTTTALKVQQSIEEDLAAVGVQVEWVEVSWPDLNAAVDDHRAPGFLLGWVADLADPDAFLKSMFEQTGSANFFAFRDDDTWALLERGASETRPVERARIYREAEQRILELAPLVPLYHTVGIVALSKDVRGFELGPLGLAAVDLERVSLRRGTPGT